jgi:tetratricopeptide (TPR) repeat protein
MSNLAPIVFISYSYDSEEHRERVLGLAERLRKDGYPTRLDQYVNGTPAERWPNWMMNQLDEAAFTLVVCTETYYKRYRGKEAPDRGHGVGFEGVLITNELYLSKCQLVKFVPILFDSTHKEFIPEPLRGGTHYLLDSEGAYQELRKLLDRAAGVEPGSLGEYQPHVRSTATPLTFPVLLSSKPNNLPFASLNDLFIGRDTALGELDGRLAKQPGGAAAAVVARQAIHGLGGVGKTRLAIEYAYRHESDYSALLFVTADSPEQLWTNLAGLIGTLPLSQPLPDDQPSQVKAVLAWLAANPDWLLILDNVDTPSAAREVEKLLPRLGAGRVLITSRISKWSAAVRTLELDVLDEPDAVEFLLKRTQDRRIPAPDDSARAKEIAELLGRLALALEQAGAYISRRRITLAKYITEWNQRHEHVLDSFDAREMQYPRSVLTTWKTSFDQLSDGARSLLNRLAWFAPDPIPNAILEQMPTVDVDADQNADDLLVELLDYSLAAREADSFVVHRLVQDVTRCQLRKTEDITPLRAALEWIDAVFHGDPNDVQTWPRLLPLASHAQALTSHADERQITEPTSRLMNDLAQLLQATNRLSEAEPLMRRVVEIFENSPGEDHPNVATALNNLAQLLYATNRLSEAEPLMRRTLEIDERSFGLEHPNVATRLNNLALLLQATNRLVEAEPLMRRALAIDERSFGPEHPEVATDLSNLAGLLHSTSRLAEAERLTRRALAIDERSFGPEHPSVAADLNNLAQLLKAKNRLAEAETQMWRALAIDKRSFGPEHPNVARDLNNLAELLYATNRLAEAEPLMRRALAIDERSFGPEHPKVAIRLNNLARLLQATNRLAEAEPLMRRAVEILENFERTNGYQHPQCEAVKRNLQSIALIRQRIGDG